MKPVPTLLALTIAASLSPTLPAVAAEAAEAAVAGAADTKTFDPVEVKGQRDKKASTNQNVTVIDAARIEDEQAENMEDLVRYLRVNAGLYNAFDAKYYQWARIRNVTRGDFYLYGYATDYGIGRYSEPGRNWRVSLNWSF